MTSMRLRVTPRRDDGGGEGLATVDRDAMTELDIASGDYVAVDGPDDRRAVAQVMPGAESGTVGLDARLRRSLGVGEGDAVALEPVEVESADRVGVGIPRDADVGENLALYFRDRLVGQPVLRGQTLALSADDGAAAGPDNLLPVTIVRTEPAEAVVVRDWTRITVTSGRGDEVTVDDGPEGARVPAVTYADVGGLDDEVSALREVVELPTRHPDLFRAFGVDPPAGVLLHGPSGTGKTLLARAVAAEADVHLEAVSCPEVVSKYRGESAERLREAFAAAADEAPSVLLLDDVHSIAAPRDERGEGDGRLVAQLVSCLDELDGRDGCTVVATTARPDAVDPALRRPGRFDREIEVGVPDRDGREEILRIHTRGVPLADDVDLAAYADRTHGFVGADLRSLATESAMHAVRRLRDEFDLDADDLGSAVYDAVTVTDADVDAALRDTEPSALREVFVEVPDVSWADVGGLDAAKTRLRETVQWPLQHPEAFERVDLRPAKGILLYGPPGTGKTLLAKAVANEADSNFISLKGPELFDKYVGESERGVREVFSKARENAPAVVFFDEIDAIATERGRGAGDASVGERVVSQLLTELDGLEALEDVVVVATTNRPDLLDDALLRPGRLDRHVHVGAPDEAARREIFGVHTRTRPLSGVDLDRLAAETDGYVGADVEAVCREAATLAVREFVGSGTDADDIVLRPDHFDRALEEVSPGGAGGRDRFAPHEDVLGRPE